MYKSKNRSTFLSITLMLLRCKILCLASMTKKYYEKAVKLPFLPELRLNSSYWQK